jgi:hypothetical protein
MTFLPCNRYSTARKSARVICSLAPLAGLAILDAAKGSKQPNCAEQRERYTTSFW